MLYTFIELQVHDRRLKMYYNRTHCIVRASVKYYHATAVLLLLLLRYARLSPSKYDTSRVEGAIHRGILRAREGFKSLSQAICFHYGFSGPGINGTAALATTATIRPLNEAACRANCRTLSRFVFILKYSHAHARALPPKLILYTRAPVY
jgi:hypothetical protein